MPPRSWTLTPTGSGTMMRPEGARECFFRFLFILLSLAAVAVLLEASLRAYEKYKEGRNSALRDYGDTYASGLDSWTKGGKLKEGFKGWVKDGYGGKVWWENNPQGFRNDAGFDESPPEGVLRVLSMGDSVTAGYRVGQHETFSYLLERWLGGQGDFKKAEVMVSCVEDPVKGLYYLKLYGRGFNPHILLLGITLGNDITQAYMGLDPEGTFILRMDEKKVDITKNEGFDKESILKRIASYEVPAECLKKGPRNKAPSHGGLLGKSALLRLARAWAERDGPQAIASYYGEYERPRLFDGTSGLGFFLKNPPGEVKEAYERLFETLAAYESFCRLRGIGLVVVLFPQRFQVEPGGWEMTRKAYGLHERCFDLMLPNKIIGEFAKRNGIPLIDPTEAMADEYGGAGLFLPKGDMHPNGKGHRALFEGIKDVLGKEIEVFMERRGRLSRP